MITTIILTYNESKHIKRCIESVIRLNGQIIIVDSYSNDDTIKIAESMGASCYQNTFLNQAAQFQWALDHCDIKGDWILRLDADEYLTTDLVDEIFNKINSIPKEITGVYIKRQVHFMGKWIRHGGYYPVKLLRLWRKNCAVVEQKWMDEHVVLLQGKHTEFTFDFVDDNLNNLQWWIQKHNNYSTREMVEYFKLKEAPVHDQISTGKTQEAVKRKRKNRYYYKSPGFLRAFLYFFYRYVIKFGFLDGKQGLIWHFLQGFWYRFLVDAKIYQIKYLAQKKKQDVWTVIENEFGIRVI